MPLDDAPLNSGAGAAVALGPGERGLAKLRRSLALPRFEAAVRLVDDVCAAAAADDAAIPVARLKRLQAIANLHGRAPASSLLAGCSEWSKNRRLN